MQQKCIASWRNRQQFFNQRKSFDAVNAATTQDEVLLHINQSLKKVSSSLNFYFQIAKFKPSFAVEKLGVREELVMMLQIDIFSEIITELLLADLFSCQTFSTVIYSVNRR